MGNQSDAGAQAGILREVEEHLKIMKELERGETSLAAREDSAVKPLAELGKAINQMAAIHQESVNQSLDLSMAIAQFINVFNQVAAGNFKARAPLSFETEALAALGKGINMAIEKVEERNVLVDSLMKELSTPVLHAWEGIIVMPLIGTLTSNRAQEAMEKILASIIQFRAKVAIIDITGVPVIDTMVAQHLIKTVKAVRILGSDAIITGISAEVASILVKIGIEVEEFTTRNSLREGLQFAIKIIGVEK